MRAFIAWFAKHGVAANLLMWFIVLTGTIAIFQVRTESSPEVEHDIVTVSITYPGAAAAEVDEAVCARVADNLRQSKIIRRVHTLAVDGLCYARVYSLPRTPISIAVNEVKTRIDAEEDFPDDIENAVVEHLDSPFPEFTFTIFGKTDRHTLATLAEDLRDEIVALPGVTLATISGLKEREIIVEIAEAKLIQYGLSFQQVSEAIRRSSANRSGGAITTRESGYSLRIDGQARDWRDYMSIGIINRSDGSQVELRDIADISDGFQATGKDLFYDGLPAVQITVFRVGEQDVKQLVAGVQKKVATTKSELPEGIGIDVWLDRTEDLNERLDTLMTSGQQGLFLVLVLLALMLRFRLAFWVSLGIPISFLGAVWGLTLLDMSINLLSLLGFIIVLGIVVDDAIIVAENIHRHQLAGKTGTQSAVEGAQQVARPVIISALTTIAAFTPLMGLPGAMGQLFRPIPIVVIACLIFSLVECLLILPAHLSHRKEAKREGGRSLASRDHSESSTVLASQLTRLGKSLYRPLLLRVLAWRYAVIAGGLALFIVTMGLIAGGRVKFSFFPPIEATNVTAAVTLPQGVSEDATLRALDTVAQRAKELKQALINEGEGDVILHTLTVVGEHPAGAASFNDPGRFEPAGDHLGGIVLKLSPASTRTISAEEVGRRLRQLVGKLPDAAEVAIDTSFLSAGRAIEVEIQGRNLETLIEASQELEQNLLAYPGVHNVESSIDLGKREIMFSATAEAEPLGVDLAYLGEYLRLAFYGEEVQSIRRGAEDVKVITRYPQVERDQLSKLESTLIRTPSGHEVPLALLASFDFRRAPASIERLDGRYIVTVSADVDSAAADANIIRNDLQVNDLPRLVDRFEGIASRFAGMQHEQAQALISLARNTLIVFFIMYALLALASSSYIQPFIVMAVIPFGLIGAIWGHMVLGFNLTMWSLLGMVALTGIVVNNGLILVDAVQEASQDGAPLTEALLAAGLSRFRPIALASLTTVAGLTPLLLGRSLQAQFLIPIAISLAFGVLASAVATLLFVPVCLSVRGVPVSRFEDRSG